MKPDAQDVTEVTMSLTRRARRLFEDRKSAAKWVLAVRYLRKRGKWVADSSSTPPNWGKAVDRAAA